MESKSNQSDPDESRTDRTVEPEREPEYVGAHSGLVSPVCQNWIGDSSEDVEKCGAEATHTVVMYTGRLHEVARCDECGEPEDAADDREWSGQLEAEA